MNEELYLIPRKKKGIFHLLFSRTGIVLMFVAVQIAIFYSLYNWFTDYFKWFSAFQLLIFDTKTDRFAVDTGLFRLGTVE